LNIAGRTQYQSKYESSPYQGRHIDSVSWPLLSELNLEFRAKAQLERYWSRNLQKES